MTTTSAPTWTPWTSFYDSAGQAATMVATVGSGGDLVAAGEHRVGPGGGQE